MVNINGNSYSASTKFNVYSPASTLTATLGTVKVINQDPNVGGQDVIGLLFDANSPAGIHFTGSVQLPAQFAGQVGSWRYLQLGTPSTFATGRDANEQAFTLKNQWFGSEGLDGWPYSVPIQDVTDPYDAMNGTAYETGVAAKRQADEPASYLPHNNPVILNFKRQDFFKTYIMFLPPGEQSRWVPLRVMNWRWVGEMVRPDADSPFQPLGLGRSSDPSEPTTTHPVWTHPINPDPLVQQ